MKYKWHLLPLLLLATICMVTMVSKAKSPQKLPTKRFAVTINVKSKKYGAKNRKDCTQAFQKAIDQAAKKGTGKRQGRVIIPRGTYYLKGTLIIRSNVYIKCEPGARIIKKSRKFAYMIRSRIGGGGGYRNIHNVLIERGIWDANYLKYTSTVGGSNMCFVHGNNVVFRNATFCNNYATHLIELVGMKNVVIEKCKLYGYRSYSNEVKKEAIQIDIAHSDKIISKGYPYDDTPCNNIIVRNNEIYDFARGIGTHSSVRGVYNNHVVIEDNNIHDLSAEAVYLFNFTDVTVNRNYMGNVGKGVLIKSSGKALYNRRPYVKEKILQDNDYNIKITNNRIEANQLGGATGTIVGIHAVGEEIRRIGGIEISQNQITSVGDLGIYLKYVINSMPYQNAVDRVIKIK